MRPLAIGRPRRVLILAPHPDDETIGAFGLIRLLRRRGARVRVVIVTDGGASHLASAAWPKARLVAERRRESRRAMQRADVMAGDVRFLFLPDGALPAAMPAIARAVRQMRGLDLLVVPAADDDHPDHVSVSHQAHAPGARRLSYLVWPRPGQPRRTGRERGLRIAPAIKRSALHGYRTQCGMITDDPDGFAMSRGEIATFTRAIEHYREERR